MNFNSPAFLLAFVPLIAVAFRVMPAALRLPLLLLASIAFYLFEGTIPTLVLWATVIWTWLVGMLLSRRGSMTLVVAGVAGPAAALLFFKYAEFFSATFGFDWKSSVLADAVAAYGIPAGISFYTFHAISYVLDIRRGKIEKPAPFVDYFLYIVFFPQLIAGPIIRFNDVGEQFRNLRYQLPPIDYMRGVKFIAFGLAYKTFFADILHFMKDKYVVGSGFEGAAFNILSYSMVIYFDFWGYSLMAIGIAKLLGIDLPRNFNEPYTSRSPKEFWRRWHVTLSFWLRDYVYLPLGGNKNYIRNIIIVFALCGLWHGAGWNFVVWGLYHGFLVILYNVLSKTWDRLPSFAAIAVTYTVVTLGWPLFYLDLAGYAALMQELVTPPTVASPYQLRHWLYLLAVMGWAFFVREENVLFNERRSWVWDSPPVLACAMFACVSFLSFKRTFIYFQF